MKTLQEFITESKKSTTDFKMYNYVVRILHTKSYIMRLLSTNNKYDYFLEIVKDSIKRFYPKLRLISDEENTSLAKKKYSESIELIRTDYLKPIDKAKFITTLPMTKEGTYCIGYKGDSIANKRFCFQHPNIKTRNDDGSVNEDAYNLNYRIYPEVVENLERMCFSYFWCKDKSFKPIIQTKEEDIFDICYKSIILNELNLSKSFNFVSLDVIEYFFPSLRKARIISIPDSIFEDGKKLKLTALNDRFYFEFPSFFYAYKFQKKINLNNKDKEIVSDYLTNYFKDIFEKDGFTFKYKETEFNMRENVIYVTWEIS